MYSEDLEGLPNKRGVIVFYDRESIVNAMEASDEKSDVYKELRALLSDWDAKYGNS